MSEKDTVAGMSDSALRKDRIARGMSQAAYGEFLGGFSRMTVIRWETQKRRPNAQQTRLIHERTGIPARDIRPDFAELLESAS